MRPTQELIAEHNAVLVALQILEQVEAGLAVQHERAAEHLGRLLEFFKGFVDHFHNGKEEDVLFPEMEWCGVQREGGPLAVMIKEHDVARGHVRVMSAGLGRLRRGEADAVSAIHESAHSFRDLLRAHIEKENDMVFPLADQLMPGGIAARISLQFQEIGRNRVGEGKHEAYHAMLHDLKDYYQIT